jgi:hypothetical protein
MDLESVDSWVDATSINSALSGLILLLMAFWATYMLARLWQQSLAEDAEPAIQHARSLGLELRPAGIRTRVVMRGELDHTDAAITWKGGALGERTVVTLGDRVRRVPLITDPAALDAILEELYQERTKDPQPVT